MNKYIHIDTYKNERGLVAAFPLQPGSGALVPGRGVGEGTPHVLGTLGEWGPRLQGNIATNPFSLLFILIYVCVYLFVYIPQT